MSAGPPFAPQQQQPNNYPYAAAPPATYPGQYAPSHEVPEGPKQCYNCGRTSTPLWRRDPSTQQVLCNACGLYVQQRREPRPQILIDADNDDDESESEGDPGGPECSHCHTHQTSVWRRNKEGEQVCNACGVYQRLRGKPRPLELGGKKIKPRARHSQT
ncbi:hypothetical protein C8F04DRAFT_968840 [Mycena alexandri]|uniref:GATA-type domain-containing protein n=1 Tax=Mycena alexandri TaxID=1745969 RepID=A0AAD6SE95_9AGAR|nr:hypothetical protein C8F04DRAFT_968840 [Mycena alexandri]